MHSRPTPCVTCGTLCFITDPDDEVPTLCYDCWHLEIDKSVAVAVASEICRYHGYCLDRPQISIIRERRKAGAE